MGNQEQGRDEHLFRRRLTALHEVTDELSRAADAEALCRKAVELGRDRLGFDRLGLWFTTDRPFVVTGSFGVDEQGGLRDERERQYEVPADSNIRRILNRRTRCAVTRQKGLLNDRGRIVGRGQHAAAPLWDGEKVIGFLAADNLRRGEDITEDDCELLVLYASSLGHFYTRLQAEARLRESEERYRDLFDSAPLCIFEEDFTRNPPVILRVNRRAEAAYGWSAEEFLALPVQHVIPSEAMKDFHQVAALVRNRGPVTLESLNLRRDGSRFPIRLSATVSPTAGLKRVIVMIEDITERRRAQEAVEAAQRNLAAAREHERRHMARELHDSVGQALAALKISLRGLRGPNRPSAEDPGPQEMDRCLHICDALIQEVRHMGQGLYPPALESLGLPAALRQLAEYFQPSFRAAVRCYGQAASDRLSPDIEIALFRIAQEALSNAHRHSRAKKVEVQFRRGKSRATLTITDSGVGFDPVEAFGRGLGLSTMRQRASDVGGQCTIESRPGRTAVKAVIPLDS